MKKTISILLPVLLGFAWVIGCYLRNTGHLNFYMFWMLMLLYLVWLLMVGLPALAAFGFQLFACSTTKSIFLRLLPTVTVLAIIVYECVHPFYGVYLNFLSLMLSLTPYLAIPVVLLGLLTGWHAKVQK